MNTKKAYKGLPMEGLIATWYTKTTSRDLMRHKALAAQLAPKIPSGSRVLEIAPGPGFFCIELARLGDYQITGLDISKSFVEIARKNAAGAGLAIDFREGNAAAMPFDEGTFDFAFCQAAFKNFMEPVKAIAEMYRVLRPNGSALIVDLRRDASPAGIEQEIKGMQLGPLDEAFTRWTFKHMLLKSAYTLEDMQSMVAQTPFGRGQMEVNGVGFRVWLTKE